jgi:hypothetical protein
MAVGVTRFMAVGVTRFMAVGVTRFMAVTVLVAAHAVHNIQHARENALQHINTYQGRALAH